MKNIQDILKEKSKDAPATSKEADQGLLALRMGLGVFFIYHGLGKFFGFAPDGGIDAFTGMLGGFGFPAPIVWAYLVAFVELFGGIAILLGFFTRISAVFLAVIALVAYVLVKSFSLDAGGLDVLAFTMALALILAGPGKISFAERWYREETIRNKDASVKKPVEEAAEKVRDAATLIIEDEEEKKKETKNEAPAENREDGKDGKNTERKDQNEKTQKADDLSDRDDDVIRL